MKTTIKVNRLIVNDLLWKKRGEAADAIGMHKDTLRRSLAGERDWTLQEISKIAKFVGRPVLDLLMFTEDDP